MNARELNKEMTAIYNRCSQHLALRKIFSKDMLDGVDFTHLKDCNLKGTSPICATCKKLIRKNHGINKYNEYLTVREIEFNKFAQVMFNAQDGIYARNNVKAI